MSPFGVLRGWGGNRERERETVTLVAQRGELHQRTSVFFFSRIHDSNWFVQPGWSYIMLRYRGRRNMRFSNKTQRHTHAPSRTHWKFKRCSSLFVWWFPSCRTSWDPVGGEINTIRHINIHSLHRYFSTNIPTHINTHTHTNTPGGGGFCTAACTCSCAPTLLIIHLFPHAGLLLHICSRPCA